MSMSENSREAYFVGVVLPFEHLPEMFTFSVRSYALLLQCRLLSDTFSC